MHPHDIRSRSVAGVFAALTALALLGPCTVTEDGSPAGPDPTDPAPDPSPGEEVVTAEGTIRHVEVEGGCWALDTGDERWEPINLERDFGPEFLEDGLRVRFEGEVRDDVATVCQVGRNLELRSLEEVDP